MRILLFEATYDGDKFIELGFHGLVKPCVFRFLQLEEHLGDCSPAAVDRFREDYKQNLKDCGDVAGIGQVLQPDGFLVED